MFTSGSPSSLSPQSAAAISARRLSQRATEELLRRVLARVAGPAGLDELLAEHADPLIAFTADRTILAANDAAAQFFGHPRAAVVGANVDMLIPARLRLPDPPPMVPLDTLTTVELPGLRSNGAEPNVSWTFGAVFAPGAPVFVMVVRDRTEIDDALEALHTSEQRFRLLVDGVRDHAVILLDAEGRITTWNSGAERIQGWSGEEVIGTHFEAFYPPEERAAGTPAENLASAIREGHKQMTGWRMRKDGSRFYAEASIWPLFTHGGTLEGFAKITHDLTARRAAEEAQRKLESERAAREAAEAGRDRLERLHRAARSLSRATTPDEVAASLLDECLAEIDAAGGVVLRLSADGKTLHLLREQGHPPGTFDPFAALPLDRSSPTTDAVRTMSPLFFESTAEIIAKYPELGAVIRDAGFEATCALPLATRGVPLGVLAVRYRHRRAFAEADRSMLLTMAELCAQALERAQLYETAMSARAEAEAASRAKDEFLAMLGHELRNPLAPIATAVELMKLRGETHSLREREVIERQLVHITRLVDDLLDISRITRGKLELSLRPLDVAEVVARAVEMASPLLEQRHHQLSVRTTRDLMVSGDPERLAQVVSNLLSNAAKYTRPHGRIEVEVAPSGADVVVSVRDNGDGISPELLPHVFDLFVQGKRSFDRSEGGLGIGLALVKNLVNLHGGTVAASSPGVPGGGSVFVVSLPRLAEAALPVPEVTQAARPGANGCRRVLVVDDNRDFADMLTTSLTALGYEVQTASDGIGALERLREFPADAAVLDLGLPVLDGFELARRIREEHPTQTPRLIAVTGYGQLHDRERAADVGFAEHLVKPVDLRAVVDALERPRP